MRERKTGKERERPGDKRREGVGKSQREGKGDRLRGRRRPTKREAGEGWAR